MGVAHHSVYLVWFEVARTDLFSKMLGYSYRELESRGSRLPIIETGCRHLAAVGYDDKVYVEARIERGSPNPVSRGLHRPRCRGEGRRRGVHRPGSSQR